MAEPQFDPETIEGDYREALHINEKYWNEHVIDQVFDDFSPTPEWNKYKARLETYIEYEEMKEE